MALTVGAPVRCAECREGVSAVYCEADAAYLCMRCDTVVHSANRLAGRHIRRRVICTAAEDLESATEEGSDACDALVPDVSMSELAAFAGRCVRQEAETLAASAGKWVGAGVSAPGAWGREEAFSPIECSAVSDVTLGKGRMDRESGVEESGARDRRRERLSALQRFRSKRANRSFVKKVRYECRKQLADSRPRVKGRFVKKCEMSLYKKYGDQYRSYLHEIELQRDRSDEGITPILDDEEHTVMPDPLDLTEELHDFADVPQTFATLAPLSDRVFT